jgi:hypothetical protein
MHDQYDFKLTGHEGTTIAVDGDLSDSGEPVAIVYLSCPMDTNEEIAIPGVRDLKLAGRFSVEANGAFSAEEITQIVAALKHATRPLSEAEKAREGIA